MIGTKAMVCGRLAPQGPRNVARGEGKSVGRSDLDLRHGPGFAVVALDDLVRLWVVFEALVLGIELQPGA